MSHKYSPVDFTQLQLISAKDRAHKAGISRMAKLPPVGASAKQLLESLPDYLGAAALRSIIRAVVEAHRSDRLVVCAMGAHVIKVGCGPIIADLVRKKVIKAIAMNGAVVVHDAEIALLGETSEEVADTIRDGSFGMVHQTLEFFSKATCAAATRSKGLGEAICHTLYESKPRFADQSVLVAAHEMEIPVTVHPAIGTDTVHVASGLSAAGLGHGAMHDFGLICEIVRSMGSRVPGESGGVWLNLGSAVLLPEVFLKAVAVARNLGADLDGITTANFDMIRHYRTTQNVLNRPVSKGRGFEVVGCHEILLPFLRQGILEALAAN